MNRSRKTCAGFASALLLALAACDGPAEQAADVAAATPPQAVLAVKDAWARPADSGATTAAYFTITNSAAVPDTLRGVSSAAAEESGLHMSMQQGRTMHMATLQSLPVPAEDSVRFAPLGAHVMLMRTTRAFAAGDTLPLTLTFVSGQTLEVRAGVRLP